MATSGITYTSGLRHLSHAGLIPSQKCGTDITFASDAEDCDCSLSAQWGSILIALGNGTNIIHATQNDLLTLNFKLLTVRGIYKNKITKFTIGGGGQLTIPQLVLTPETDHRQCTICI